MPYNSEYFTISAKFGCHSLSVNGKFLRRWNQADYGWGFSMIKLSDCKDLKDRILRIKQNWK